jgi:DNA-directed RNA polymerase subunit F
METDVLLIGFLVNLVVALVITRFIYYPKTKDKNNIFTFLSFNTIIFFTISILTSLEISIGVGFGLFALFSILRYRTDPIPIRDMTYLFIILALPVMNSVLFASDLFEIAAIANAAIIAITFALENGLGFRYESSKKIKYEKIDLIKPEKSKELIKDLEERTGIKNILKYKIGDIDFLKDSAEITIYYKE